MSKTKHKRLPQPDADPMVMHVYPNTLESERLNHTLSEAKGTFTRARGVKGCALCKVDQCTQEVRAPDLGSGNVVVIHGRLLQ